MNKKQRKTLDAIFAEPIRRNILWNDVVSLVKALGATVTQGDGSRVRFDLNNLALNIHSPHPQKELKLYSATRNSKFKIQNSKLGYD